MRPFGQIYRLERPFLPKLGFCTGFRKSAIPTRVLNELLSYFLCLIGTLWVIDSTSKEFWLYYKIWIFGAEKAKTRNLQNQVGDPKFDCFNLMG